MVDFTLGFALQISFSPETLAAIDRLAGARTGITASPPAAMPVAQPAAPGVSAPACDVSLEPAEGPGRAAGETQTARPEKTRRSLSGWATPERKRRLAELWPTKRHIAEIHAALQLLEGPPIPSRQIIRSMANGMGLNRPTDMLPGSFPQYRPATTIESPECAVIVTDEPQPSDRREVTEALAKPDRSPETVAKAAAGGSPAPSPAASPPITPQPRRTEPYEADQETIRAWAAQRGISMGKFDLDAANRKAKALGHPGFILKTRPIATHAASRA